MDEELRAALARDRLIDITTTGRSSGLPRRIETVLMRLDGRFYLTGRPPRPRRWYANLLAEPAFTLHVKESATADLPVRARPIVDAAERRRVLEGLLVQFDLVDDLDAWLADSPLVEIELPAEG